MSLLRIVITVVVVMLPGAAFAQSGAQVRREILARAKAERDLSLQKIRLNQASLRTPCFQVTPSGPALADGALPGKVGS